MSFKIVKEFSDPEFYEEYCFGYEVLPGEWFWGLGSDGKLWRRIVREDGINIGWWLYSDADRCLSLKTILRIAKKFAPLMVFL